MMVGAMNSASSVRCRLPAVWGEVILASKDNATLRCGDDDEAIAAASFCDAGPV